MPIKTRLFLGATSMSSLEYTIPVNDLDAGGKEYRFPVRAGWVRGALEGHEATSSGSDGALVVRASKSGPEVVVQGRLDAELTVPCARCLEPARLPVHSDITVLFVPRGSKLGPAKKHEAKKNDAKNEGRGEGGRELTDDEANTLPFDGETVVLDELVRDELVLEVPMIPLCSEDCPGMSPAPDPERLGDKPIDPRLAPLLDFAARKPK